MSILDLFWLFLMLSALRLLERSRVLHTPGGLVLAAEQIARALREHPGKVTPV